MADWFNITDTQVDPDAPLTSQLAYAWRDNPVAIAEGAAGAPLVQPRSLDTVKGRVVLTTATTAVAITGLDPETVLTFTGSFANGTAGTAALQLSTSADGGATWSAWSSLTGTAAATRHGTSGILNLKSGVCDTTFGTFFFTANSNTIRFRHSVDLTGSGNDPGRIAVMVIGKAP